MSLVQIVVAVAPARVLLPIVAREQLGGDTAYGIVLSLYAAGGLAAALLTIRWRPREPGLVSMLSLVLVAGVSLAGVAGLGGSAARARRLRGRGVRDPVGQRAPARGA